MFTLAMVQMSSGLLFGTLALIAVPLAILVGLFVYAITKEHYIARRDEWWEKECERRGVAEYMGNENTRTYKFTWKPEHKYVPDDTSHIVADRSCP